MVRCLDRCPDEGRTEPLPRGHRRQRHQPGRDRATLDCARKVYHDVINAEWSDVWGSYFWNARLNTPGYNNQVTSGTSIPQAYVPFYTRDALGIAGQTTEVSEPLLYNVFDQTQSQSAPVASIQICQNGSDPMCNLKSTAWSGFSHPTRMCGSARTASL